MKPQAIRRSPRAMTLNHALRRLKAAAADFVAEAIPRTRKDVLGFLSLVAFWMLCGLVAARWAGVE